MKPAVRREVAGHLQKAYGISERRACSATGFSRSSQRYRTRSDPQVELRLRLKELAAARVRCSRTSSFCTGSVAPRGHAALGSESPKRTVSYG